MLVTGRKKKKKKLLHKREAHKISRVIVAWKYLLSRYCGAGRRQCVTAAVFCFFGNTSKPFLASLRFRLLSIHQITTSQPESLTLFLFPSSISLASKAAHLAFSYFFCLLSQFSIPPTNRSASIRPPPTRNPVPLTPSPPFISPTHNHNQRYWALII